MPRRRGWILLALGAVLALATGGLVFYLLQQAAPAGTAAVQVTATPIPSRPVPVAARLLTAGTIITEGDILDRDFPEDLIPTGIITDSGLLMNQRVLADIPAGSLLRTDQVGIGPEAPLSAEIPQGRVVLAFAAEDLLNTSRVIREGDRIDLLLTLDIQEETTTETRSGKSTNYTLQNINVFRLVRANPTQDNPNPEVQMLLFEMSPQDAVVAKHIKDSGGTIDFTLRSRADTEPFTTDAISQDYLFDNYNFSAPRSSTRPKGQ